MKTDKIKQYITLLYASNSPETRAYVDRQMQGMKLELIDLYQSLEMSSHTLELYRDEGGIHTLFQVHSHRFYELLYCRSNCGAEYLVGTERYILQRGDLLIIAPGVSHTPLIRSKSGEPYKGCALFINSEFLDNLSERFHILRNFRNTQGVLLRTQGTVMEHLDEYFQTALTESELQDEGWDAAVIGAMLLMLTRVGRVIADTTIPSATAQHPELLDAILSYIGLHFDKKILLEDISSRFFISPSTITLLFRKKMGISFYKYVTQLRLTAAKNLMFEHMPLEQIAIKVGFGDYSSFYRAFRQEFGVSPREYNKQLFTNQSV